MSLSAGAIWHAFRLFAVKMTGTRHWTPKCLRPMISMEFRWQACERRSEEGADLERFSRFSRYARNAYRGAHRMAYEAIPANCRFMVSGTAVRALD